MSKFIYFTSDEKRQANEVDLPDFLLRRGERLLFEDERRRRLQEKRAAMGHKQDDHEEAVRQNEPTTG